MSDWVAFNFGGDFPPVHIRLEFRVKSQDGEPGEPIRGTSGQLTSGAIDAPPITETVFVADDSPYNRRIFEADEVHSWRSI